MVFQHRFIVVANRYFRQLHALKVIVPPCVVYVVAQTRHERGELDQLVEILVEVLILNQVVDGMGNREAVLEVVEGVLAMVILLLDYHHELVKRIFLDLVLV